MKSYAKKREHVRAVRWTGEVTPELAAILGDRKYVIGENRQMALGNGWYADVGNWVVSGDSVHKDGFQVVVLSHDVFERVYEEVHVALIEQLRTQLDAEIERAENAETALKAPEVHWECQQRIDALEAARWPTADEHTADVRTFVDGVDAILIDGLRLSREAHPNIFRASNELERKLRHLLEDHAWTAARSECQRIKERIVKEIL
jgi:hypothetical protein